MNHLDEMPNKQQHCYLVSYQAGKHTGHTHIYCDAPLTPPRDTVDFIKSTADDIGCNQGDLIITSIFYFGFIFPQAVIEDEQGQEEPEVELEQKKEPWEILDYYRVDVLAMKCKHGISIDEPCKDCYENIPL